MLKNDANDQSINRLKQLVASRYGKGLELRPLTDVSGEVSPGGHALKGSDLHIPLRVQDAFLGTAVVPSAEDLSVDSKNQISQMVRMVLEPTLYRDFLERREGNLKSLAEADLDTSNLRLFEEPAPPAELFIEETPRPRLLSNLVALQGHDPQSIKRAALTLHEMTGRWAFAPFADMAGAVKDVDDLLKLGALTLFVEDAEALGAGTQDLLVDYLSRPRTDQGPLIVLGTAFGPEEISRRQKLNPALTAEISVNNLELDRVPMTEKSLRQVLGIMFFSED